MSWIANIISKAEAGRWYAHITFGAMFIYDIVILHDPFGWNNAIPYAIASFGGEASVMLLKLAQLKYGVKNADVDIGQLEDNDHSSSHWGIHGGVSDGSSLRLETGIKGSGVVETDTNGSSNQQ